MAKTDVDTPDEVLVVGALVGDLEAFDTLVLRYRPAVIRISRAIVGLQDAEDVAQEAFLIAFKSLPSLDDPAKFGAWLSAITRHFAVRYGSREQARSRSRVELDDLLLETVPSLLRPMLPENWDAQYLQALSRIPQDYALVLQLHFLDAMPLKRIARFLGISLANVKWRIFRGKQLLRNETQKIRGKEDGKGTGT